MFISKIFIKNFRTFDEEGTTFNFKKGISTIIGENNVGKTSLIDAIRIALYSGSYRKNIVVTPEDFHIDIYGKKSETINIDIYFSELSEGHQNSFFLLLDEIDNNTAILNTEFNLIKDSKGNYKVKDKITGGRGLNTAIRDVFDNINLIFLPALRNAESDLKPSKNSQIANILSTIASENEDRERIISEFISASENINNDQSIRALKDIINFNLEKIEKEEIKQNIDISLTAPTFEGISSSLNIGYLIKHQHININKAKLEELLQNNNIDKTSFYNKDFVEQFGEHELSIAMDGLKNQSEYESIYSELLEQQKTSYLSLKKNGLGYNNILSIAASLGNLQEKPNNEEFLILLVEEPEAHLHPQLLELLFNFFKNNDNNLQIQMLLTTHSPTLVSKSDLNSLNIMSINNKKIECKSISDMKLDEKDKADLERYLDVTKSQMFFAKKIVFVEGISEALLINEFAKRLNKPFDKYSVEIVNIQGVAFDPFKKIFAKNNEDSNLKIPCVIISDDDRCTDNKDSSTFIRKSELVYRDLNEDFILEISDKLNKGVFSSRVNNLIENIGENINVQLAFKTLEYELALIEENQALLLDILKTEHPDIAIDIEDKMNNNESTEKIAIRFWVALSDCKASFAQKLAFKLSQQCSFRVPKYIEDAIEYIIP